MLAKLIMVVVFAAAIGAVLLGLRQQRLQMSHEMAKMHAKINKARQETWDMQVRISERMEPEALKEAIERAKLDLEPITPGAPVPEVNSTPKSRRVRHGE